MATPPLLSVVHAEARVSPDETSFWLELENTAGISPVDMLRVELQRPCEGQVLVSDANETLKLIVEAEPDQFPALYRDVIAPAVASVNEQLEDALTEMEQRQKQSDEVLAQLELPTTRRRKTRAKTKSKDGPKPGDNVKSTLTAPAGSKGTKAKPATGKGKPKASPEGKTGRKRGTGSHSMRRRSGDQAGRKS